MRDEALYLTVSDSYSTAIREHTHEAEFVTLGVFLARPVRQRLVSSLHLLYNELICTSYDLLFIPDCDDRELDIATHVRDVV